MFVLWNFTFTPNIFSWGILGLFLIALAFSVWYSKGFHTYFRASDAKRSHGFLSTGALITVFLLIGFSFFILLWEPIWKTSREKVSISGNTIVFTLDISKSMLAEDMKPSRIEVAKRLLSDFVKKGNISKMGLVIFAGEAFTAVPITEDQDSFLEALEKITPNTIRQELPGLSGTSIGNALLLGKDLLDRGRATDTNNPVIILLTDGEANTGIDPVPVAKSMAPDGIPVYSIGMGSAAGTDLYTTDRSGVRRYFLGEDGKPIRAILDEWLLRYIASETKGEYYSASNEGGLTDIFKSLSKLSEWKKESVWIEDRKPLETNFLGCILILFTLLLLLRWKLGEASFF